MRWLTCGKLQRARIHDLPVILDLQDSGLNPSPGIFLGSPQIRKCLGSHLPNLWVKSTEWSVLNALSKSVRRL